MYRTKRNYVEITAAIEFSEIKAFYDARNALWESDDDESFGRQYVREIEARSAAEAREDKEGAARASGKIGGIMRRYRNWMVLELTKMAFKDVDTSREFIRNWQKIVFGKSIDRTELAQYADKSRAGAGRKSLSTASAFRRDVASFLYRRLKRAVGSVQAEGDDKLMKMYETAMAEYFKARYLPSGEGEVYRPRRSGL